jgi:hypothetical protein
LQQDFMVICPDYLRTTEFVERNRRLETEIRVWHMAT